MRSLAVVVLVLVVGAWWNQHRTNGQERALGRIASEIAGRPVEIHCQGLPSSLLDISNRAGEVRYNEDGTPPGEATLKRDTCRALKRFSSARAAPSFECVRRAAPCERSIGKTASAVRVLAHEAWHLRGVTNEAEAECYALQTTDLVAQRLGASLDEARAIALWNARQVYRSLPSEYRSSECRPGTSFDLQRGTTAWP